MKVCFVITACCCVIAILSLFAAYAEDSAPKQAAAAAIAIGWAVIPYVFSRAWEKVQKANPN